MAFSAHKDPEQLIEHVEEDEALQKKASELADCIKASKHFIIFTGAGISTSAGIPDFRGPDGVWTLKAQGKERTGPTTSSLKAIPTVAHMSILALQKAGFCQFLVSQNTDGLHRKSGIAPDRVRVLPGPFISRTKLAELHGNSNLEICSRCGKQYLRDFRTRSAKTAFAHETGRSCTVPKCGGELHDSIINFGENLPEKELTAGFDHASKADLCLVLGSSLTVTPAANIPKEVGKKAKLVVCNLQMTPLDDLCSIRIHAKCDDLMILVMRNLGLSIPEWRLHRRVLVECKSLKENREHKISIQGIDVDSTPVSFIKRINLTLDGKKSVMKEEPFEVTFKTAESKIKATLKFEFMGHYMEPVLETEETIDLHSTHKEVHHLEYNPFQREWKVDPASSGSPKGEEEMEDKDVLSLSISELKRKLDAMNIDHSQCLEKAELMELYKEHNP